MTARGVDGEVGLLVDGLQRLADGPRLRSKFGIGKVDMRLPGKGNLNSHGARPVYENHLDDQVDSDQ